MAEVKKILAFRMQASTLLEVLVSMIMLLAVFGIAMMIMGNVARQSLSARKLRAKLVLQQAMVQFKTTDQEQVIELGDNWRIERDLTPFQEGSRLTEVKFRLYDEQHQLLEESQKIMIDER